MEAERLVIWRDRVAAVEALAAHGRERSGPTTKAMAVRFVDESPSRAQGER
jgi:hypothetical protein